MSDMMTVDLPRRPTVALVGQLARRWMIVPLALALPAAYATFFEASTDSQLFRSIIEIAPAWVWGTAWLAIATTALLTLRFGLAVTYQTTNVSMIFMSLMWGGSTFVAKTIDNIPVTSTALGVWACIAGAFLFAAFMPYHVAHTPAHPRHREPPSITTE